jgi:hypothetical protein
VTSDLWQWQAVRPYLGADKEKDIYSFLETLFASDPSLDDKNKKKKVSKDNFEKNGSDCRKPTPSRLR